MSENLHLHYILCKSTNFLKHSYLYNKSSKVSLKVSHLITIATISHVYNFMALLSTASVCLIPVIYNCGIHFQLSIHRALNGIY